MQKKISLSFDSSWVLSKKDDEKLPVEAFVDCVEDLLDVEILDTSLTDCEIVIKDDSISEEEIENKIESLLKKLFANDSFADFVEYSISDYEQQPEKKQATEQIEEQVQTETNDKLYKTDAISKINALIGASEFKQLADECFKIAPGLIRHGTVEMLTHQCYIFAINEGNGLTTYLNLFAELLSELNLFEFDPQNMVVEEKILSSKASETGSDPFSSVYSQLKKHSSRYSAKKGKIISIDISEWMTKITDKAFREFLSVIDDHLGENIIVFRVPFVEKEILKGLKRGIGDVLFVRDISFLPFDADQLTEYATDTIKKYGFSMQEDAWKVFDARITEEKSDGRFYGMNTVDKVIREMIYRKQLSNAISKTDDTVIKKSEIAELATTLDESEKTGIEVLSELIGMETIRAKVLEIVAQIEMSLKNKSLGSPCIHMRFVGNPGTGKTTVARVIGKILKEKGILRNGNFFEYSGRDFCGRYVGETAPKTAAMCRDAYGSVLFIDEAYSLYRGDGISTADYGREAIDTLIAEMENHRSDLVVIMAGYTDDMANLMRANAGLESRMPYIIEFPNYTREQLGEIFMLMVKKAFTYRDGFEQAVKEYFDSLPDEVVLAKEFSNARFVRNLFERTWGKAVLRAQLNNDDASTLIKEDFMLASSEKEFKKIMVKPSRTLGFI